MRIVHVIDSLGRGGAEQVVVTLAAAQAESHAVTVVHLRDEAPLAAGLRLRGVGTLGLGISGWSDVPLAARRLNDLLGQGAIDVLHAHLSMATLVCAVSPLAARHRVVSFHNMGVAGGRTGGVKTRILRLALSVLVPRRFDIISAVSEASANAYQRELRLPVRPLVMPNPIDVSGLRAAAPGAQAEARRLVDVPVERSLVVSVAKLTWEKNHRTLLEALARVRESERPLVAIVGDGPLRAELQSMAEHLGVASDVRWCGELDAKGVLSWLAAATVFVLPSVSEGLGVAALEAMALGVPVIASSVGGLPELLGEGRGWLVPPGDPDSLARAMVDSLADRDERVRRSERAGRLMESYCAPAVAARWEAVLRDDSQ